MKLDNLHQHQQQNNFIFKVIKTVNLNSKKRTWTERPADAAQTTGVMDLE